MGGYSVSFRDKSGRVVCRNYDINSFFFQGIYTAKDMAIAVKGHLEAKGFTEVTVKDRESKLQSYSSYTGKREYRKSKEYGKSKKHGKDDSWKARLKVG